EGGNSGVHGGDVVAAQDQTGNDAATEPACPSGDEDAHGCGFPFRAPGVGALSVVAVAGRFNSGTEPSLPGPRAGRGGHHTPRVAVFFPRSFRRAGGGAPPRPGPVPGPGTPWPAKTTDRCVARVGKTARSSSGRCGWCRSGPARGSGSRAGPVRRAARRRRCTVVGSGPVGPARTGLRSRLRGG